MKTSSIQYSGTTIHEKINSYLRGNIQGYYDFEELENHVFNLDKLTNMDELKEHSILYRGQQYLFGEKYEVGMIIDKKEFLSTSFNENKVVEMKSTEYLFKIYSPKGTKGVQLNNDLSVKSEEYEWLLPRNTKFKVLSFDENSKIIELLIV
ncbi:MAG: ADP-ribosyltransferase [Methanobrevibacter sp.]|nr:ADP-ribosyltransferase [Methanobrevibacter sp.]